MFRFSSTASVTLVEVGWLAPCNAKPVRARRFSFETGSEPSRFFRSETPRTIAQPTETWLLDRYAQPRLFFNDFHVRWTNLRGPANSLASSAWSAEGLTLHLPAPAKGSRFERIHELTVAGNSANYDKRELDV